MFGSRINTGGEPGQLLSKLLIYCWPQLQALMAVNIALEEWVGDSTEHLSIGYRGKPLHQTGKCSIESNTIIWGVCVSETALHLAQHIIENYFHETIQKGFSKYP